MTENPCLQELDILKSIDGSLKNLISNGSFIGSTGSWKYLHVGKSWFFEQVVTYPGAAISTDLILPMSIQLNRIEQIWNDATIKGFSIRVFTDPSLASYIELDTQTGNTATSRLVQLGTEYKYPAGSMIRIYSGVNTATKTDTIRIQVDEL
jgi:hypothetical protein